MAKTQILIVEDDGIIAMDIESRLKKLGFDVSGIVSSGEKAIKHIIENKPDLVLMDIVLKGEVDGFAAAREIHSRFEIPSIYMTGYTVGMIKEKALVPEPYECLVKPVADSELKEKINSVLQKQKEESG